MTDGTSGKRDFFVSFNQADRAMATWIAWVLEEAKYSVWFQDWDFRGNFVEHMNRAHTQAHRTLAVLSDSYFGSDFTLAEWSARFEQDPAAREDRLVPVKVGELTGASILGPILYADLTACEEEEAQRRLLERVRKAVDAVYRPKPEGRPVFPDRGIPARQVPDKPRFPIARHNLPQPHRSFVGRTAELRALEHALANSGGRTAITQPRAIIGLGGVGKTLLALHYAYAHLADYDLIFWLRAEDPATLAADYVGMASALGLDAETPDQMALIAAMRGELEGRERFLLVFDDATEPAALDRYLPRSGAGHVLITSRYQDWEDGAGALELHILPEPEAMALLLGEEASDPAQRATAARLVNELGYLPLALAQARAFMHARKVDVAGYRQQLATYRPKVMAWRPPRAAYPLAVAQAWQTSADHAAQDCPAARELLQLLAFFAPDAIPRDLLGAELAALPEGLRHDFDRDTAIEALGRFSLLRVDTDTLTIHRLVQAVTRDVLDRTTTTEWAETAVQLVNAALPRPPGEYTNWPAIGKLLPHALATAEAAERLQSGLKTAATVFNEIALYHKARASWAEAEILHHRAITIGEKSLGPEHPYIASFLNNLADLYRIIGRYREAEHLFGRAITIGEKALGPEHPALGATFNNLALLYQETGRLVEAEPLHEYALLIREKHFGPEHLEFAAQLNNIAEFYQATGHLAEAERLHQRALNIRDAYDPEHPQAAQSLNNLALIYQATGRLAEAESLLRKALAILEKRLPQNHPDRVLVQNSYSGLLAQRDGPADPAKRQSQFQPSFRLHP